MPSTTKVSITTSTTSPPAFDHGASKYKCFCGYFHVKPGAIIVAIIMIFLLDTPILNCIDLISERPWIGSFLLLSWIAWIPIIICLFFAVSLNNRYLLAPFIAYGIISALGTFILAIVYTVLVFGGGSEEAQEVMEEKKLEKCIFNFFNRSIWYIVLTNAIHDCYVYFSDLDHYEGNTFAPYAP